MSHKFKPSGHWKILSCSICKVEKNTRGIYPVYTLNNGTTTYKQPKCITEPAPISDEIPHVYYQERISDEDKIKQHDNGLI